MEADKVLIFALIWSHLSRESEEVIRQYAIENELWDMIEPHDNPHELWKCITQTHTID
jgi:hypothetical protein